MVIRKINSLRTVYRKEQQKVNKSNRSGAGADEIYKPTLWYYDLLHFLNETPRPSKNNLDENEEPSIAETPVQVKINCLLCNHFIKVSQYVHH